MCLLRLCVTSPGVTTPRELHLVLDKVKWAPGGQLGAIKSGTTLGLGLGLGGREDVGGLAQR